MWKILFILIILNIFIFNIFLISEVIAFDNISDSTLFYVETPNGLEEFGNYLYYEGEYFRAISEYKRLLFFYPQYICADTIQLRIGECYAMRQKWDLARNSYQSLLLLYPNSHLKAETHLRIGQTYFYEAKYDSAKKIFTEHIKEYPTDEEISHSQLLLGHCYLWEYQWKKALEEYNKNFVLSYKTSAEWLAEQSEIGMQLPHKSPFLAGLFSTVIPGTGQWYCKRGGDAFFSFYLLAMTSGFSYLAYKEEHYTTTYILASLSGLLYLGNIYGGIMSAKIHNKQIQEEHLQYIENEMQNKGWFK